MNRNKQIKLWKMTITMKKEQKMKIILVYQVLFEKYNFDQG
jgi:hypothetical protein